MNNNTAILASATIGENASSNMVHASSHHVIAASSSSSWEDVLSSLQNAKDEYTTKASDSRLRSCSRSRELVVTLQALADMIPDQDGLSIMRGGLKGIFQAVQRRIQNREAILRAFEDIPLIFGKARRAFDNHSEDMSLVELVNDLFQTVKRESARLIEILNHKEPTGRSARKWLRRHPENEAQSIDDSLDSIRRASQRLGDYVESLVGRAVMQNLDQTKSIGTGMAQTLNGLRDIQTRQTNLERGLNDRDQQDRAFREMIAQKMDRMAYQLQQDAMNHQAGFYMLAQHQSIGVANRIEYEPTPTWTSNSIPDIVVIKTDSCHDRFNEAARPSSSRTPSSSPSLRPISPPNPSSPQSDDLLEIARRKNDFNHTQLGKASWLLLTDRFKLWMEFDSHHSDMLLVDGYMGSSVIAKTSPLSVVSASLLNLPNWDSRLRITHYFCGLHSNHSGSRLDNGPRGMLRSLIEQLTAILESGGLNPHPPAPFPRPHRSLDCLELCTVFGELYHQIPRDLTVYIILNDISEFETDLDDWEEELCHIIGYFQDMIRRHHHHCTHGIDEEGPAIKLLLTAAHRSITVTRQIDPRNYISLEAGNVAPDVSPMRVF